jgi:hypothetical protein
LRRLITPTITFSLKPFLKRLAVKQFRAFGQAFRWKGCDQTFLKRLVGKSASFSKLKNNFSCP